MPSSASRASRILSLPIFTAWDLGIGDSTAIWVFQIVGNEIHVLDYIENSGVPLHWYVKELNARGWSARADFLPHDAKIRELGTGFSRVETLGKLGRRPELVAQHKLEDGINAVRLMLPRMWFDAERCSVGLECLRQYRSEYDEKSKVFRNRPKHDWTSHGADAARYMAMAYREMKPAPKKPQLGRVEFAPLTVNDLIKLDRLSRDNRKWG